MPTRGSDPPTQRNVGHSHRPGVAAPPRLYRLSPQPLRLLVTLCALSVLLLAGTFTWQHFFGDGTLTPGSTPAGHYGAFVAPPLNAHQINQLQHLSAHMSYKQLASLYIARMSLDEELGQLIMVEYDDQYYSPDLDMMISKLHAGGVIMYEFQMMTFAQTKRDIAAMQQHARLPLLISSDEEGGIVHRLTHIYPPRPSALSIYQTGDPNLAAQQGHKVAHDLLALGINVNLAPDVDVALRPDAPDQVTRTFGYTVDSVEQFAGPYMQAMQSDGVMASIKHFPGLGDAAIDAHIGLPVVNRTKEQLYAVELAPFKHFIQTTNMLERPGMIMPTDVLMPAIDPVYPAELSPIFMTDILRKEFGYDGVTLTDALYMKGVEINGKLISMPEAGVLALNAGNDMLLGPTGAGQMLAMLNGLKQALHDGRLAKSRVDEAATRVIALKMERHLMAAVPPQA
jgi:beta-N-acetylhexosaminidase